MTARQFFGWRFFRCPRRVPGSESRVMPKERRKNWIWNWEEHKAVWKYEDKLPQERESRTWIGAALRYLLLLGPTVSPSNFLISRETEEGQYAATRRMDHYIFRWALFLTLTLVAFSVAKEHSPWVIRWILIALTVGRILDSISYRWYYILCKCAWKPWRDPRRSLAIALANVYEIVIAFAILYLQSGQVKNSCGVPLPGGTAAAYFSFITITTVGYGDYAPAGGFAQFLVVSELFCGITFLAFIIPALVSLMTAPSGDPPAKSLERAVRDRAYALYELRGSVGGDALQDWSEAEDEVFRERHPWLYEPKTQFAKLWRSKARYR
jgi:hypothetical protein